MPLHIDTPLVESRALSASSGRAVWLKLDALQPSGSFKLRGVGFACETHHARGARRFVSSSGGNAGLAVAYAGRQLGVPVTVVVPETTTERARELLRLEGAEVVVVGRVRRRFFRAGGATASRTEVVADRMISVRSGARCRELLGRAIDRLVVAPGPG